MKNNLYKMKHIRKFNENKIIKKSDTLKSAIKKAEFNIMNDDPKVKNKEMTDSERQSIRDYIEELKNSGIKIKI